MASRKQAPSTDQNFEQNRLAYEVEQAKKLKEDEARRKFEEAEAAKPVYA